MCRYTLYALKLSVNDAALCRVHRLKNILTLVAQYLVGSLVSHINQNFFSVLSVTADVQDHAESLFAVTVGHEVCKISDGIQCLTVTADRCTAVLTVYCDMDHIILTVRIKLAVDADAGEYFRYKRNGCIFSFTGFVALEGLIIAIVYVAVVFLISSIVCNISGNADGNFFLSQTQEPLALIENFNLCLILLHTEFGESKFDCFFFRLCGLGYCLFHACLYLLAVRITPHE